MISSASAIADDRLRASGWHFWPTKALGVCRRAADTYRLTGEHRWAALMRCLVIVRKH